MTAASFDRERRHGGIVAGVDEAGRGPWAGPVVAAAVILDANQIPPGIADSKALKAARRDALAGSIKATSRWGIGIASVAEIDALNILQATFLAMTRAVAALPVAPALVLVDGNRAPKWHWPTETIVKGDAVCRSIAAASILAKVARDHIMQDLHRAHPNYGWSNNMGYGTKYHADALQRLGPTAHHRMSFAPCAAAKLPKG